jgi:hypothetical protein
VKVYVDGAYKATVDLDAASAWRSVVWRGSWSSLSTHTVELRPVGDGWIYLDAWVSLR